MTNLDEKPRAGCAYKAAETGAGVGVKALEAARDFLCGFIVDGDPPALNIPDNFDHNAFTEAWDLAFSAVSSALTPIPAPAAGEAEPVAWRHRANFAGDKLPWQLTDDERAADIERLGGREVEPLYAAPVASPPAPVQEEAKPVAWTVYDWEYTDPSTGHYGYARTPEKAEKLQAMGVPLTPVYVPSTAPIASPPAPRQYNEVVERFDAQSIMMSLDNCPLKPTPNGEFVRYSAIVGLQSELFEAQALVGRLNGGAELQALMELNNALQQERDAALAGAEVAERELYATVRKFNCDSAVKFWQRISLLRKRAETAEASLAAALARVEALNAEMENCRANCFGGKVEGTRSWVAKERLDAAEASLAAAQAKQTALIERLWPNRNFGPQSFDEVVTFVEQERKADADFDHDKSQ